MLFRERARARNTRVEANLNHSFPAQASPTFVALGTILAVPGNVAVDAAAFGRRLAPLQGLGAALVVAAFVALAAAPAPRAAAGDDAGEALVAEAEAVENPARADEAPGKRR